MRNDRLLSCLALGLAIGLAACARESQETAALLQQEMTVEESVTLIVRVSGDTAEILDILSSPEPAKSQLPMRQSFKRAPVRENELRSGVVATLHAADGRPLATFDMGGAPLAFYDTIGPDGQLTGGYVTPEVDIRRVTVPLLPQANAVSFSVTESRLLPPGSTFDPTLLPMRDAKGRVGFATSHSTARGVVVEDRRMLRLCAFPGGPAPEGKSQVYLPHPQRFEMFDEDVPPSPVPPTPPSVGPIEIDPMEICIPPDMGKGKVPPDRPLSFGVITGSETIRDSGDPKESFDIVIMGEGFTDSVEDVALFKDRVGLIVDGLLGVDEDYVGFASLSGTECPSGRRPYCWYRDKINVHVVTIASGYAGVEYCPWKPDFEVVCCPSDERPECCPNGETLEIQCCTTPSTSNTFFQVEGNANNECISTNFKMPRFAAITEAASSIVNPTDAELLVVIVNCSDYGAKVFPHLGVMLMSADEYDGPGFAEKYAGLAAHEAGHAIAQLGEEYISCDPPPVGDFPNIVSEEQIQPDTYDVWWTTLADADEKTDGLLNYVYDCDSAGPAQQDTLGLFWGAQYADIVVSESACEMHEQYFSCDAKADTRGCSYYRPMAKCTMRTLSAPYCDVCLHEIEQALQEATTPTPGPS